MNTCHWQGRILKMYIRITVDRVRCACILALLTTGYNQILEWRRGSILIQVLAWLLTKRATSFPTRAWYSVVVHLLMHLLVIRSSETSYYLLTTVLVISTRSDWKLLSWEVLSMHHKMMSVAVHSPSPLFGSFDHGRQLNHLPANNPTIRYGIADLTIPTPCVILW